MVNSPVEKDIYPAVVLDRFAYLENREKVKSRNLPICGLETCIAALQVWISFFLFTAVFQIALRDVWISSLIVIFTGGLCIGLLIYRWLSRITSRLHLANLSLAIALMLIVIDVVAALVELLGV